MTINWKMAAIVAAGCFVLSFVTGLFAQVHFLALFLRALLLGLLGGGLAVAFRALVQRFLPELGEGLGAAGVRAGPGTGANVDIVVADEAGADDGTEELDGEGIVADGGAAGPADGAVRERSRPTAEKPRAERHEAVMVESEDGGDFAEELEELKASPILPEKSEESREAYQPVKPPDVIEDVDVLPDLESFSDSFAAQDLSGEGGGEGGPESMPASPSSGSGSGGSRGNVMNDADTIAQAIRTALHRDKKG